MYDLKTYNDNSRQFDTERMAEALCEKIIENINPEELKKTLCMVECGLYYIKTCAQNPLNHDFWRVLYNVLGEVCEKEGSV